MKFALMVIVWSGTASVLAQKRLELLKDDVVPAAEWQKATPESLGYSSKRLEVLRQWEMNGNASWKEPLLRTALSRAPFAGKHSTPYGPGTVHDYMHAKVTVADDVTFLGSFNLSHSGEENAENVLELTDPALADELAAFIDRIRDRYPGVEL